MKQGFVALVAALNIKLEALKGCARDLHDSGNRCTTVGTERSNLPLPYSPSCLVLRQVSMDG